MTLRAKSPERSKAPSSKKYLFYKSLLALPLALNIQACHGQEPKPTIENLAPKSPAPKETKFKKLSQENPLLIVYPSDNATIAASSTFFIGSLFPGHCLSINGQAVATNKDGYFAQVVNLKRGNNNFALEVSRQSTTGDGQNSTAPAKMTPTYNQSFTIKREQLPTYLKPGKLAILPTSLEPKVARILATEDILEFAARATPGASLKVQLGNKLIPMVQLAQLHANKKNGHSLNLGLDAAYGEVFQRSTACPPDLYAGFYRVLASDTFTNLYPKFILSPASGQANTQASSSTHSRSDTQAITHTLAVPISVYHQPQTAQTVHDDTIIRVAPDKARLTPLPAGVRLLVDGASGENIRVKLAGNKHAYIKREDLNFETPGAPPPEAVARCVNLESNEKGEKISVPLNQRLPFSLEQSLHPNKLTLKIWGCTLDTDWIQQEANYNQNAGLIETLTARQSEDGVTTLEILLKGNRQWGFTGTYEENKLCLQIKKGAQTLKGLKICLDPGHGGRENGSLGCSGLPEKALNLAITQELKAALEQEGAQLIMTRDGDEDVSLNERVEIAQRNNADLLLSIHNNALPDGRNPITEHGTSTYWYHPQSQELANCLKNALLKELGWPDLKARYQNLALCRPSQMPAVLVEVGFMVNPDEFSSLTTKTTQKRVAQALVKGLKTYYERLQ
jgi:N-acetylmuramoyl-L-alanine amidase